MCDRVELNQDLDFDTKLKGPLSFLLLHASHGHMSHVRTQQSSTI
jgi:hypothetical protein